jgi:nucleolar pre-ribosomal-associated protein 1
MATISEQWPFVVKANNIEQTESIAQWLARLLGYLKAAGEDEEALSVVRDTAHKATDNDKAKSALKKAFKKKAVIEDKASTDISSQSKPTSKSDLAELPEIFGTVPVEDETHAALRKWEREDLEESLEQGYVGDLFLFLCSEHEEIRRQAYAAVGRFMVKIKVSL